MEIKKFNFSKSVFVFDLDDTLYQEKDYQLSGFKEIIRFLNNLYKIKLRLDLNNLIKTKKNILEIISKKAKLSNDIIESLIWIYRLHDPNIKLKKKTKKNLFKIKKDSLETIILTDGRSITQRLKLKSLGLNNFKSMISEEYNDKKPSLKRFKIIMKNIPANNYIYIGDNTNKDFLAPNKLKWLTIGIIDKNHLNIHKQNFQKDKKYLPKIWIKSLSDLYSLKKM